VQKKVGTEKQEGRLKPGQIGIFSLPEDAGIDELSPACRLIWSRRNKHLNTK